jgi:GMP synthase (glutamine-hydrolysing)
MRRPLFIIKTGAASPETVSRWGDFEEWIRQGLAFDHGEIRVVRAAENEPLPDPARCRGAVITGSHAMVTDRLSWSEAIAAWIPAMVAGGVPLLGICYGHQLLAAATGGRVGYHPGGREVGTVMVELLPAGNRDPLFSALPPLFPAHAMHAQTVLSLPPGAILLAGNSFEPHHAFRLGRSAWGVQFHPEYTAGVMRSEIARDLESLTAAGPDPAGISGAVRDTPEAATLLRRFGALVRGRDPDGGSV